LGRLGNTAFLSWVVIGFAVGSTDRLFNRLHISYDAQIHLWRIGVWVLPIIIFFITRSACRSLQHIGAHPVRAGEGDVAARPDGHGIALIAGSPDRLEAEPTEPPVGSVPGQDPGV
jgi:hypothetical protein